jgi:hypothetical protein
MRLRFVVGLTTILAALGCGGSQGTAPHDMSAAQHEATAGQEERAAQGHAEQYNPDAKATTGHCSRAVCWTSEINPTEQHKTDAAEHHELAEKHRAAAQALRDSEAASCTGLDDADRETSPFYHREDIASVSKVERPVMKGRVQVSQLAGGKAVFRAVQGMTAEWLQRLVNCHTARAAALGHQMPEMSYCPLVLKGVTATVSSTGDGFAIDVTSEDAATAEEILKRMQAAAAR